MYVAIGCRLRVEVELGSSGQWLWAEYDSMSVDSENNNHTLHVTGYHGNAGDAFNSRLTKFAPYTEIESPCGFSDVRKSPRIKSLPRPQNKSVSPPQKTPSTKTVIACLTFYLCLTAI